VDLDSTMNESMAASDRSVLALCIGGAPRCWDMLLAAKEVVRGDRR